MYSGTFGGRAGRSKGKAPKKKKKKKNKDEEKQETPPPVMQTGAGSGVNHKTSRKASNTKTNNKKNNKDASILLPSGFSDSSLPFFFDASSDVVDVLDKLAIANKKKKNGGDLYKTALFPPKQATKYGGGISHTFLKPGRVWDEKRVKTVVDADPLISFVLGLSPAYDMIPIAIDSDADEDEIEAAENDQEEIDILIQEGMEELMAALDVDKSQSNSGRIVGLYANLDYTPKMVSKRPGMRHVSQLRRLKAAAKCAVDRNLPLQIRITPGSDPATDNDKETNKVQPVENNATTSTDSSPDVQVVQDLVRVLLECTPPRIHLSRWCGKSDHLLKILKAFPVSTLWIGLDASVGFAKASTNKKECAFEIPLDRLLLESSTSIPAPVAAVLKGKAFFCHGGLIPFVAEAVAEQKPTHVTALEVSKIASENVVACYGTDMMERATLYHAVREVVKVEDAKEDSKGTVGQSSIVEGAMVKDEETERIKVVKKKKVKKKKKGKRDKSEKEKAKEDDVAVVDGFDDMSFFADEPPAPSTL